MWLLELGWLEADEGFGRYCVQGWPSQKED